MTIIFNGKDFASNIKSDLKKLNKKKVLLSILIGDDAASQIYLNIKKRFGEEIGVEVLIKNFDENTQFEEIKNYILEKNNDLNIDGIMIQLPPKSHKLSDLSQRVIEFIDEKKDVDGLKINSKFNHPTAIAIFEILKEANFQKNHRIAFVGGGGMVGQNFLKLMPSTQIIEKGDDLHNLINFDVVISATGVPDLIKSEYLKNGVIAIDVGAPKAEFEKEVYKKAKFITPVPGGVGPVTVAMLMKNILEN